MKILVHVRNKSFNVQVGNGTQLIKWLAFVGTERFSESEGYPRQCYAPSFVYEEVSKEREKDASAQLELLDPRSKIIEALRDGQSVRVLLKGDKLPLQKDLVLDTTNKGVTDPFNHLETGDFSDALFNLLHDPNLSLCAEWQEGGGNALVIKDKHAFTYNLIPKYFPHHSWQIFSSNLKKIGFMAVGNEAGDSVEYLHPFGRDVRKMTLKQRVEGRVAQATQHWKTTLDLRRVRDAANEPDPVKLGEAADLPMQHLKKKLANPSLCKDFLIHAGVDVDKLHPQETQKQELLDLQKLLLDNMSFLRAFFRHFLLGMGEVHGMSNQNFRKLCQSCGIPDQQLYFKDIDSIFVQANHSTLYAPSVVTEQSSLKAKSDTVHTLSFNEFLLALMRISLRKYYSKGTLPSQRFAQLLKLNIMPLATQIHKDDYTALSLLDRECATADVMNVLERYRRELRVICEKTGRQMTFDTFKLFLMQSKVVGDETQFLMVKKAFILSGVLVNHKDDTDMNLQHFERALVVLCKLCKINGTTPESFTTSLDSFLQKMLHDYSTTQKQRVHPTHH